MDLGNRKQYTIVILVAWVIFAIPSFYFAYKQVQENKVVDDYLTLNDLKGAAINKETAVQVSDLIRKDFNVDESSFQHLVLNNRPFLREDTNFLLTHKEGLCGEGTRVIVRLLGRLGFDATRITLYNKRLLAMHTLVSVIIDNKEFFVDSINSQAGINNLLKNEMIASSDFDFLHYNSSVKERRDFAGREGRTEYSSEEHRVFFDNYWIYSFEATPYTKILSKLGFDFRVFNFSRPNFLVSSLAEQPNLISAIGLFLLSLIAIFFLHWSKLIKKVMNRP